MAVVEASRASGRWMPEMCTCTETEPAFPWQGIHHVHTQGECWQQAWLGPSTLWTGSTEREGAVTCRRRRCVVMLCQQGQLQAGVSKCICLVVVAAAACEVELNIRRSVFVRQIVVYVAVCCSYCLNERLDWGPCI
jgi:hypothetical protein